MELQALLVLGGVGLAGVAVLLLMSLFSSSGTSYEEAIAQQRKATTELLALAENKNKNNKKNNKKAIKKQAKKEKKETAVVSTGSDHDSEAPAESGVEDEAAPTVPKAHVEFSPPVIVDVPRDVPPNIKIRKRGKDPKVKPILVNKEDPSCVSDPAAVAAAPSAILNNFVEIHPKDEFELLQSTLAAEKPQDKVEEPVEKKESKAPKPPKTKGAAPKPALPIEAIKEETRERRDSGDSPKDQRKAKKAEKKVEKPVDEVAEIREEVVPPLNAPQPSDMTTDKLLKQALAALPTAAAVAPAPAPAPVAATPPKKKKKPEQNVLALALMAGDSSGVNVGELEAVIRSVPLSDTEIQTLTEALLNKHHDPLPVHSEWTEGPNDPMQKLKKQLADKEKALADEIDASKALHARLKELRLNLNEARGMAARANEAREAREVAARAEVHTLQTRIARLVEENHAYTQDKMMLEQKLGAEAEAQAQHMMHIQRLTETEAALLQQIAVLQAECSANAHEVILARDSCIMAQQQGNDMAQQLQETTRAWQDLEQQYQQVVMGEQRAQQELRAAQERLAAMADLQNEVQRLSSRAQAAEANADKIKEEAEKQKQQLSRDLASLAEELAEAKQLRAGHTQNGLPDEQHKVAELAAVESVVSSLREELSAAQLASRDQREHLNQLTAQLNTYQDKNNEAILKAEEAQYAEVAGVLRAACPAAAPPSATGRDWLHTFADNLKKELQKREQEKLELQSREPEKIVETKVVEKLVESAGPRHADLLAQNQQMRADLDKYKRAINYTEDVLSRLQQNVSSEEARWAEQLAEKEHELSQLRTTTLHQMQSKIEALESQLAQAQAQTQAQGSNHNHSFVDAERLTEERLMAGLSEKLSLDVCNGPSQVGLEDK